MGSSVPGLRLMPESYADICGPVNSRRRNIGWVEDDIWQPPSEATRAARQQRLAKRERIAREEEEQRQRLIPEREADPVWQATRRIHEAEDGVREAQRAAQRAVRDRDELLREPAPVI